MFVTQVPVVGRFAFVIACTALLAGCAGPTVEPTQAGLNRAVGDARTALSQARDAYRSAEYLAARRAWPAAARAVDEVMFALQDARRVRKAVDAADKQARLAHREAVARRDRAEDKRQFTLSTATVARTRNAITLVDAQVSQIEAIARKARNVGRTPPLKAIQPPGPTPTPAEELRRFELPDTGFDQDVFGAQQ